MSTPLGRTAGNALEVAESVEVLAGGGPPDVVELTLALAREMLAGAGLVDVDPADALRNGSGDGRLAAHDQGSGRRSGRAATDRAGAARGVIAGRRRARPAGRPAVGVAAWRLGAGRARKEDPVLARPA